MQRLGPYELLSELGRGAMGVVYKARHRVTGAERALKVIDSSQVDREGLARFKREAEALARVDKHPNLVRVHESGTEGRTWFYAMELVHGTSLRKLLEKGPLPTERALELSAKLARALAHCHENGVIHRDVKPDNVLVDEHGEPRLVDFGLVRDLYKNRLTRTGDYLGTPAYMAAEQIKGEAATTETDVYALGMVAFETLTGRRPYSATTVHAMAKQILDGDSSTLAALTPELPAALSPLLARCLAPDRRARPSSAAAVAAELEAVLAGMRARTAVPARSVHRLQRALLLLLGLALVLGAVSGFVFVERQSRRDALRAAAGALARAARFRATARALEAVSLCGAARAALEAIPEAERDPGAVRDLALAQAWLGLARHDPAAVGAVDSAAATLGQADEAQAELRLVRALALLDRGALDDALAVLRSLDTPDLVRLRARLLLDHQRWAELDSLASSDEVVRGCQLWSTWARGPVPGSAGFTAVATDLQKSLRSLSPAAFEEFRPLVEIAVARAPALAWIALGDMDRGVDPTSVGVFEKYALAVESAWHHASPPHADRRRQLREVTETLDDLEQRGYQLMQKELARYLATLDRFEAVGKLLASPFPGRERDEALLPLTILVTFARLQAAADGEKSQADLKQLENAAHAEVGRLRAMTTPVAPEVRTLLSRLLLYDTERTLDPDTRDSATLEAYLAELEGHLDAIEASAARNQTIFTRGRTSNDPSYYQRRAASVCARLASRKGAGPLREGLLARARKHLERAEGLIEGKRGDYHRLVAEDSYYVALVANDGGRLAELRAAFDLAVPTVGDLGTHLECFVENLLVAAAARERGDADEANRCFERAKETKLRASERGVALDAWYYFLGRGLD